MPLNTVQMVLDKKDLRVLIDGLDDLILEYDQYLAQGYNGYDEERFYALDLKERVQSHLDKLES